MAKIDYKKDFKDLYLPKSTPMEIDVPKMNFIMVDGAGDPNGGEYQLAVPLLYSLAFTIKMKGKDAPGYTDFAVFPLEGLWWCTKPPFDFDRREDWRWTSMLRQPDFVTPELFRWAVEQASAKKPEIDYAKARFESFTEGLCVQMMHIGPYATEPETVEKMHAFMALNGLKDETGLTRKHHEIYLGDPRRAAPEKWKTVLRHPVART